jgi:Holliday junction resolvase RusA-like endonuclease
MASSTISFWIDADPRGKERPRFDRRTGHARTAEATRRAEQDVRFAWKSAGMLKLAEHTPIACTITCYLRRPGRHILRSGELSAEGQRAPSPFRTKPDVDNVAKLVLDALEGCAYPADVAITDLLVVKRWADPGANGRLLVELTAVEH